MDLKYCRLVTKDVDILGHSAFLLHGFIREGPPALIFIKLGKSLSSSNDEKSIVCCLVITMLSEMITKILILLRPDVDHHHQTKHELSPELTLHHN